MWNLHQRAEGPILSTLFKHQLLPYQCQWMWRAFPVIMVSNLLVLTSEVFEICLIAVALCISANTSINCFTGSGEIPNQRAWKFIPERHKYCYVLTGMVKWMKVKVLITQSCPALCDPMDCSLPGSSVLGSFQVRILECVTIPFSRGSSQPRDQPSSPALQADSLLSEPSDECPLITEINIFQVILFL